MADIQAPPRAHAKGERLLQRRADAPASAIAPEEVQVGSGQNVTVTLRGEGQPGRTIDFKIRAQPQHGTLGGDPTNVTRNSATVVYVPGGDGESIEDEFTFTVQVPGGPVSAPQTVRLRLTPAPPSLALSPGELDFGAVKAGDSAQALLTLENQGGSEANGRVAPPPPFVVDGPADYHLARGAKQTFRLVFQPTHEASFNESLHLQAEASNGVRLIGTGLADPRAVPPVNAAAAPTQASAGQPGIPAHSNGLNNSNLAASLLAGATPPNVRPVSAQTAGDASGRSASLSVDRAGAGPGQPFSAAVADTTAMPVNEAAVRSILVNTVGRGTVDMTWQPPTPLPASYRVELAYLLTDDDKARLDWRPYAQTDIKVTPALVSAHLRGLPAGRVHMLRVVAVDSAGRLAAPSPIATVMTQPGSTWWRPTIPKALVLLLIVAVVLIVRRKREEQEILADIDASRRRANAAAGIAWRS